MAVDFTTQIHLVTDFFHSWFDIDTVPFIALRNSTISSTENATFWIPSSLGENATEAYFRNALPSYLQLIPTIGEVLDWEYQSRLEYANTIKTFYTSNHTMSLSVPYFNFVIDQPARFCKRPICDIGVETDQLANLNGPGVSLTQVSFSGREKVHEG
ncbi:hypothetical protein EG329_011556 [Mollisiaceae sp. DMI_Dod_QoI]|nr:hypothetical protein EG329_011556 [Helotiales sp. DMI_Dod_QoI]